MTTVDRFVLQDDISNIIEKYREPLSPGDEIQMSFDISSWLGTDQIISVVYSAVDERGANATTTVLNPLKHTNTATVISPWIKAGATPDKHYTVRITPTTINGEIKAFFIKFSVKGN